MSPCCESSAIGRVCSHLEAELLALIQVFRDHGRPPAECIEALRVLIVRRLLS